MNIRLRVSRRQRTWDPLFNDYRNLVMRDDGWLSGPGDEVSIDVPDGRVIFRWHTQAVNDDLIYASLTHVRVRRGLLRPTRRKALVRQ